MIMPGAFTEPDMAEKVRAAVKISNLANVRVQARADGHSYGAYGWGCRDGTFDIGLKYLNRIVVDKAAKTASIGSGALLGDVTNELHRAGLMTPDKMG
ncbi:hypothetical protein DB88DRAFT_502901 [Papiliotrema laurentii]|uniref:FAD linked oxidase N-terminal domain-containing protein n=1 Tax=Papiliotrema laurentii TaxID=5418 RepID=A0AAD9FMC5_PAPLA|nr:hypothetical protein DB88DRAFT_502901 [Papiliotrema laurentii]